MKEKQHSATKCGSAGKSKAGNGKCAKPKKVIGKRLNKKQINSQVKEAVEKTNSCNTDLYAFYSQANEKQQKKTAPPAAGGCSSSHSSLIEQVAAAFNPACRQAAVSQAADSMQRIALLPSDSELLLSRK